MAVFRSRKQPSKSARVTKPRAGNKRSYRKYFHEQPSKQVVFVEEPDSEGEEESSEEDEQAYSSVDEVSSEDDDVYFDEGVDAETGEKVYLVDLDDLENLQADEDLEDYIDALEGEGEVYDMNDELLKYYDDEDDVTGDEPEEILDVIDMNDQLVAGTDSFSEESSDSSSSELDSELSYTSDEEGLNDQLHLENVRRAYLENMDSESESSSSSSSESESSSSSDSESSSSSDSESSSSSDSESSSSSDSESSSDSSSDSELDSESDSSSSSSSDSDSDSDASLSGSDVDMLIASDSEDNSDDGVTIYQNGDEDLSSDDDVPYLLTAADSDNEGIVDLTYDLENSKDCELSQIDKNTFQLNLRFPSLVEDEVKIDYLKDNNELIVRGKFDFAGADEEDDLYLESDSELSSASDSDSESSSDDPDYSSESDSESDEEIKEDSSKLIQDYESEEIPFEKHFTFERPVKFEKVKAKFLANGELQVIIPLKRSRASRNNKPVEIQLSDDDSYTEEME